MRRDQRIDRRILHARVVARVLGVGRLAAEQVGELLARRVRAREAERRDLELEFAPAAAGTARSPPARKFSCDAQLLQVADPGADDAAPPLSLLSRYSSTSGSPLALRRAPSRYLPARLLEQTPGPPQVVAQATIRPSVRGGSVHRAEHRRRHLAAPGLQQGELLRRGRARWPGSRCCRTGPPPAGTSCRTSAGSSTRSPSPARAPRARARP